MSSFEGNYVLVEVVVIGSFVELFPFLCTSIYKYLEENQLFDRSNSFIIVDTPLVSSYGQPSVLWEYCSASLFQLVQVSHETSWFTLPNISSYQKKQTTYGSTNKQRKNKVDRSAAVLHGVDQLSLSLDRAIPLIGVGGVSKWKI